MTNTTCHYLKQSPIRSLWAGCYEPGVLTLFTDNTELERRNCLKVFPQRFDIFVFPVQHKSLCTDLLIYLYKKKTKPLYSVFCSSILQVQ